MPLSSVSFGSVARAADINQIIDSLQCSAGKTETGKYYLTFDAIATGFFGSVYIPTLSRGSVPVSVTVDTSDAAPVACSAPATGNLSAYGFHIFSQSTASSGNCRFGGFWTVQY